MNVYKDTYWVPCVNNKPIGIYTNKGKCSFDLENYMKNKEGAYEINSYSYNICSFWPSHSYQNHTLNIILQVPFNQVVESYNECPIYGFNLSIMPSIYTGNYLAQEALKYLDSEEFGFILT